MGELEDQIRTRIQTLLPASDPDTTTERSVRATLEQEFGTTMEQYKPVIKEEVLSYLDLVAQQQADAAEAPAPQPAAQAAAAPSAGSKRKLESREQGQHAGGTMLPLSELKRVDVRLFKGQVQVDIRELYKHKENGELKPGQKGLALTAEQWAALAAAMPAIDAALGARDTSYSLELSHNRRASVTDFKAELRVDLREHYEADGQLMPGKKGISLQQPEWQELRRDGGAAVQAAVDALLPRSAAAGSGQAGPPEKQARTAAAQQSPAQPQEDFTVGLGSNRRATVRKYNGRILVDFRETYEKDGQTLPGKKGIALTADQFRSLKGVTAELTQALESSDLSYSHALGDNVREFYVKKGETEGRPGAKGLDMPADEWSALCANIDALVAEAERLLADTQAG